MTSRIGGGGGGGVQKRQLKWNWSGIHIKFPCYHVIGGGGGHKAPPPKPHLDTLLSDSLPLWAGSHPCYLFEQCIGMTVLSKH